MSEEEEIRNSETFEATRDDELEVESPDSVGDEVPSLTESVNCAIGKTAPSEDGSEHPVPFQPEFSPGDSKPKDGAFQYDFNTANDLPDQSGAFEFKFDDFPQDGELENGASFIFDVDSEKNEPAEVDELFDKFISLISNPCFEYSGRPLADLFKYEDPTDSAEAALALLMGHSEPD
jgi:hypothetical protein